MESTRKHLDGRQPQPSGVAGDIQRLKTSTAETSEELREFLASLRGRSPQEVMGVVAQSNLVNSILLATVISVALLLLLTAIPYALKDSTAREPDAAVTETQERAPATAASASAGQPDEAETAAVPDQQPAARPDAARAAEAMGIGEAADPDAAPEELDGKLDKLLDGL
jgi:hypothetical protein